MDAEGVRVPGCGSLGAGLSPVLGSLICNGSNGENLYIVGCAWVWLLPVGRLFLARMLGGSSRTGWNITVGSVVGAGHCSGGP